MVNFIVHFFLLSLLALVLFLLSSKKKRYRIRYIDRVKFSLTILLHSTDITIMFCSFSVLPEEGIDALNDQRGDNQPTSKAFCHYENVHCVHSYYGSMIRTIFPFNEKERKRIQIYLPFPRRVAKLHKVQLEGRPPPSIFFSLTFPKCEVRLKCLQGRTFSRHQHVSSWPLFLAGGIYRLTA